MIKRFNEVFEIKENDTLGDAIVKGYAKGVIQGVVLSGISLGVLVIGNKILKSKVESSEEELEEGISEEELTNRAMGHATAFSTINSI